MSSDSEHLIPVLLRVPEAARLLGVGRSLTYELIARGELEVVHVGTVIRVPVDAVRVVERRRGQPSPPSWATGSVLVESRWGWTSIRLRR